MGALAEQLARRADVRQARTTQAALGNILTWMFEVDLLVVELGDGPDGLDALRDLEVAVPAAPVVAVASDSAVLDAARRRGCLAALRTEELSSPEARSVIEAALSGRDSSEQWESKILQLREVFGAVDVGVIVYSPTGRVVMANEVASRLLGLERSELLHHLHSDLGLSGFDGEPVPEDENPLAIALERGDTGVVTRRLRRPDGDEVILELRAQPAYSGERSGARAVVMTIRDVTEQVGMSEALVSAERRGSLLLEHAAEGYLVLDAEGAITEASTTLGRYFPPDELIGRDALELVHPDDRERAVAVFSSVAEGSSPTRFELRLLGGEEGEHWVEATFANRISEPTIGGLVINVRDIDERKSTESSMARLSAIVESSEDSIIAENLDGVITAWNPASRRLYGYSAAEALGRASIDLVVPPERRAELFDIRERLQRGERVDRRDTLRLRRDGSRVVVSLHVSPIYDVVGQLVGTSTIARDVSDRRRLERERSMFEERFRVGFEQGAIGMAMVDLRRRFTRVNRALCTMLGRSEEELVGQLVETFVHPSEVDLAVQATAAQTAGVLSGYRGDRRFVRRDGEEVYVSVDSTVVRDEDGEPLYLFAQLQDVTDRKRSEQALEHQALHDALTGLPNRALVSDRLGQAIGRAGRNGTQVALVYLDLDRFMLVNDTLGHGAGDSLLVDLAQRLIAGVRRSDTVARLGGDEFLVMREDVTAAAAVELGDQVVELFHEPFAVDDAELYLSASAGVVLVPGGASVDEALRDADAAMYRAKERGGGRVELFNPELRRAVAQRFDLERALAFAIERNEFRVVYQPIVSIEGQQLVGMEALVRWQQPQWGLLLPGDFIAAAEETGHIAAIGEFVLREALGQVMRWRRLLPGAEDLWVSVNLSSRQLSLGDPVDLSAEALAETMAPPEALRLELTESAVMEDVESAITLLRQLRLLGIKIAIDDFGTGHSSLSYLSRLPISSLKIDHSFVWGLGPGLEDSAIVRAIVSLADTLDIEPCAEGVETEEQRRVLDDLGCGLAQGYLFAPPMWPSEFERWARGHLTPAGAA